MIEYTSALLCLVAGGLMLVAGCGTTAPARTARAQLLKALEQELQANTGWVRIHAAEALLDHGESHAVALCLGPEALGAGAPYRIGIWRVMSRAAGTKDARAEFSERIRGVLLDPQTEDRLNAAESMAKLGLGQRADRPALQQWLQTADTAASPFLHWLLLLSGSVEERAKHEATLVSMLESTDPVARLRAAFALGRVQTISGHSAEILLRRAEAEPADSPARVFLLEGALNHAAKDQGAATRLKEALAWYLKRGKPQEQLQAAGALGRFGALDKAPELEHLLHSGEADARIGAASALLYLRRP